MAEKYSCHRYGKHCVLNAIKAVQRANSIWRVRVIQNRVEQLYGKHFWEDDFQAAYETEKWRFMVDDYSGNVGSFKVRPSDDKPFSIDMAREESKKYMPADSKFVEDEYGNRRDDNRSLLQ